MNDGTSLLFIAAKHGHFDVVQYLVEEQGVDVNKATTEATGFTTPLHVAAQNGHVDVAVCLMERGMADLNARTTAGQRPIDLAQNEEMRQAIVNEEKRRRDLDLSFKRSVIPPNPSTAAEQESNEKNEEEDDDDDDDDSSSSDEEEDN